MTLTNFTTEYKIVIKIQAFREKGKADKFRLMLPSDKQFGPEFDSQEKAVQYFKDNPIFTHHEPKA